MTYDEVSDGFDIPISIETEETELSGQFSTIINFSIDIYQLQSEVQKQPTEPDEQVEQPAEVDLPADPVLPEQPDSPVESELPEEPESSTDSQVPQTDEESADSQDTQESSNDIGVSDFERRE